MRSCGSLPPLVEGKIHGYLKLVIDAIAWSRGSPGRVSVFPSWWGEPSSVRFRPVNLAEHDAPGDELAHVYAVKTNLNLFKEYIRNCESVELVIVADKTNSTIGSTEIIDLLEIFEHTCVSKYYTIVSLDAEEIGEIHVSLSLSASIILDTSLAPLKSMKSGIIGSAHVCDAPSASELKYENFVRRKDDYKSKAPEIYTSNMYKSILKEKKHRPVADITESYDARVTEKLVAQAIAKAQRLRGALMKETQTVHPSELFDDFSNEQPDFPLSVENEANLYQYMLGKDVTHGQEKDALHTLRSISPASSLVQFASDSIGRCKAQKSQEANTTVNKKFIERGPLEIRESNWDRSKEVLLLDHIDTIQIVVESFNLNDAGYRRVKSSCILCSDNMPLHVTYIVQYDISSLHPKYSKEKQFKHALIKVSSKSQADMAVYFKHSGIYNISITKLRADYALKFKLFIRHLNQKTPTELGMGSIYVRDIVKSDTWCISQHVGIINKGIKIGELDVTAQLGCKSAHFGNQYVDTIMPNTKNVPSLKAHCLSSNENNKVKRITGSESKAENHVSVNSERVPNCLSAKHNLNSYNPQYQTCQRDTNTDGLQINVKHQESNNEEKIVLHGLIYIAEGKQLPVLNTYLVCKTCWKDDNSMSYICENTNNPVYQFHQSMQFTYGKDLLDRVKNNYIIIEVYSKHNDTDELLGLAKLSVHQFYLAYNNPQILPRLLSSKYPVVSVDGWVPVTDPITGKTCGELLALVALGTIYQIQALEVLRGHVNIVGENEKQPHEHAVLHASPNFYQAQDVSKHDISRAEQNRNRSPGCSSTEFYAHSVPKEDLGCLSSKTQAIQTDISMITKIKENKSQASADAEHTVLHKLVDQLNQVLIGGKSNANRAAQTDADLGTVHSNADESNAIDLNLNNTSDDSDSVHLQLPTDAYRSVGVGAEYDEDFQQQSRPLNCNNVQSNSSVEQHPPQEVASNYNLDSFKAVVEIESALHLTRIECGNEMVEPSTYVTFQAHKSGPANCFKSYISTDIASYTCNPKWNWKADVRLPTELLLNNEKRLILKIWHVNNPDSGTQADLDKDIVLGFAAIDLTVLLNGFPMISGWFHIMDFTGKCKGQIQVKVTPLDNLAPLTKSASTARNTRGQIYTSPQSNWIVSNPLDVHQTDMEQNHKRPSLPIETRNDGSARDITTPNISTMNGMHLLENESMSFLSLSLKQKLTELDEITKRLQSRLHDVTSTAFEDEFDNEFDVNEPSCFNDNCEANNDQSSLQREQTSHKAKNMSTTVDNGNLSDKDTTHICSIGLNTVDNRISVSRASPLSKHVVENSENCHRLQNEHNCDQQIHPTFDNMNDYPARGAKVHINHLLDKLSLQPTTRLGSSAGVPLGRNIIELLQNLHQSNNNLEHGNKCRPNTAVCTVPTQTDNSDDEIIQHSASGSVSHFATNGDKFSQSVPRPQINNKVSDAVRDELMAEEDSGTFKTDELSTYLMASNVRHMDLDTVVNPLVYSHLMPDMDVPVTISPEGDAAEQLDNYYTKVFGATIDETLDQRQTNSSLESSIVSNHNNASIESAKNAKHSRMSPSGLSAHVDGNINLTVVHKSCYDDLLATNSREFGGIDKSSMTEMPMIPSGSACSRSTATSESSLSRQAPDGGNPVEDNPNQSTKQQQNDSRESSIS